MTGSLGIFISSFISLAIIASILGLKRTHAFNKKSQSIFFECCFHSVSESLNHTSFKCGLIQNRNSSLRNMSPLSDSHFSDRITRTTSTASPICPKTTTVRFTRSLLRDISDRNLLVISQQHYT